MTAPVRPPPPYPAPEGHVHVAQVDPRWRLITERTFRGCRWGSGPGHQACGAAAVAELNRGRHLRVGGRVDSWWAYCADHLYGRWIEDGQVMWWAVRPEGEAS